MLRHLAKGIFFKTSCVECCNAQEISREKELNDSKTLGKGEVKTRLEFPVKEVIKDMHDVLNHSQHSK